jgi:hypothetical protein
MGRYCSCEAAPAASRISGYFVVRHHGLALGLGELGVLDVREHVFVDGLDQRPELLAQAEVGDPRPGCGAPPL